MLKTLIRVRISSIATAFLRKTSGRGGRASRILLGVLFGWLGVCLLALVGMLCFMLAEPLAAGGLGWLYHAAVGLVVVSFCFVGTVFLAQSQIFEARDNELLLSMPVPPQLIVLSRLLSLLLLNYLYTAVIMVPAAVVYAFTVRPGALFYVGYLCGFLLLPMLSMTLTCAAGWAVSQLLSRTRHKNLVTALGMMVVFFGAMAIYMSLSRYAMMLIERGEEIAAAFRKSLPPLYAFGRAAEGSAIHLLLTAVWCVVPLVLVYVLLARSFRTLATTNRGTVKVRYVAREMSVRSPRAALLRKELGRIFGFPLYLFNCALGGVMALLLGVLVAVKGPGLLQMLGSLYGMGDFDVLLPFAVLLLCFCAVTNCTSAVSISLEGSYLWIVRAHPVNVGDLFFAKVMANVIVGGAPLLLSSVLVTVVLPLGAAERVLVVALPMLVQLFVALGGLALNLLLPRLDWISQAAVVKQSASVMVAVFGGMGLIALPSLVYGLWLCKIMGFMQFGLLLCVLLAVGCLLLARYLPRGGRKRFELL